MWGGGGCAKKTRSDGGGVGQEPADGDSGRPEQAVQFAPREVCWDKHRCDSGRRCGLLYLFIIQMVVGGLEQQNGC